MFNLRLALRTLFKTPFVTVVAIVSLALGIGANAAMFPIRAFALRVKQPPAEHEVAQEVVAAAVISMRARLAAAR